VVEGFGSAESNQRIGNLIWIGKHILCRNAQDLDALALQPLGSDVVPLRPISEVMCQAVNLDR